MNITGLGTDRLRLKLRIMSDDDLWWLFLNHREECSHEFWEELGLVLNTVLPGVGCE